MRTEDKVMNNGKLQAKQETLKSLHCPSPQSSLFNSHGSSLNTQRNKESATRCPQQLFIDMSTELLNQGKNVRFRAPGLSMYPAIKEGETITVAPVAPFDIKRGDILLYVVGKKVIAHRVVSIKREQTDFATHSSANFATKSKALNPQLIFTLQGDASPTTDDPVDAQQILGKVVSVERHGRKIDLYSRKARIWHIAYTRASRLKRLILCLLRKWGQILVLNKKHRGDLL
jgi:hypothetical protein